VLLSDASALLVFSVTPVSGLLPGTPLSTALVNKATQKLHPEDPLSWASWQLIVHLEFFFISALL
jgi:hypothetical protein